EPCHNQTVMDMNASGMTYPPKVCEDCHLSIGGGPYDPYDGMDAEDAEYDDYFHLREDLDPWTEAPAFGVPMVREHIFSDYAEDINVSNQSDVYQGSTRSSCFGWNMSTGEGTCHGVAWDFNTSAGGFYAMNKEYSGGYNRSDPYMYNTPVDALPDTRNCIFCHNNTNVTQRKIWGNASQILEPQNTEHPGRTATANSECYNCHVEGGGTPSSFHSETLTRGAGTCRACHFNYGTFTSTTRSKFVNETKYNESVHWNQSVIDCEDCHTNTSDGTKNHTGANYLPPESGWKWCEACHVVQPTYANQSPNKDDTQRHNITNKPQLLQYNVSGTLKSPLDIKAEGTNQSAGCIVCHDATLYNNSVNTYNRTSGKDCRYCHTFPDLEPESPYT
ncbi:MAG: hypothetical protein V3T58_00050, partial [Candidatus Hydrothermarchaeales archaeon]